MNEHSRVRRALYDAIENQADRIFCDRKEFDDALSFVGKDKECKRYEVLENHYDAIIREKLGSDSGLVDELETCLNMQCGYIAEAMYRRGAMEAFGLFRMFLDADDRLKSSAHTQRAQ